MPVQVTIVHPTTRTMGKGGLNRILILQEEAEKDGQGDLVCSLPAEDARAIHIRTILCVEPGTKLRAAFANVGLCQATVLEISDDDSSENSTNAPLRLKLTLLEHVRPPPPVSLVLAMPRPRATRRAVRLAAQLGVASVTLTGAARVERSFFCAKLAQQSVLDAAARDGVMQAAIDATVPPVHLIPKLHEMPATLPAVGRRVVLHPGAAVSIAEALKDAEEAVLAVGPEGGWLDEEVAFLERHGFVYVGLGDRVLASEVAVTVAITLAHAALAENIRKTAEVAGAPRPALVGIMHDSAKDGPLRDQAEV